MAQLETSDNIVNTRDKQADDLARKQATLRTTLTLLEAQRTSLLQKLNTIIPAAVQQALENTYNPSIAAHSTPSNRSTFSPSNHEQLNDEAKAILRSHISALHTYNEVKDVAQGMMGLIAESRGVRIRDLYLDGEFGVAEGD